MTGRPPQRPVKNRGRPPRSCDSPRGPRGSPRPCELGGSPDPVTGESANSRRPPKLSALGVFPGLGGITPPLLLGFHQEGSRSVLWQGVIACSAKATNQTLSVWARGPCSGLLGCRSQTPAWAAPTAGAMSHVLDLHVHAHGSHRFGFC